VDAHKETVGRALGLIVDGQPLVVGVGSGFREDPANTLIGRLPGKEIIPTQRKGRRTPKAKLSFFIV
jgi:hypothetical protein